MADRDLTWRVSLGIRRAFLGAIAAVTLVIATDQATSEDSVLGALIALPFAGIFGLGYWILGHRPRLTLTDDELIARNYLRTRRVPRAEVRGARPAYEGLRIETAGGRIVIACAVQKTNWSVWRRKRTRADDVVDQIVRWARERPAQGTSHLG